MVQLSDDIIGNFSGLEAMEPQARNLFSRASRVASVVAGTVVFRNGSPCENYLLVIDYEYFR